MVPQSIAEQRRVLTTSALLTFSLGAMASYQKGEGAPSARFLVGTAFAFTLCSAMVDLGMPLGAGFALLILISALMFLGPSALKLVTNRVDKKPKKNRNRKVRK